MSREPSRHRKPAYDVELTFLPGLDAVVAGEVAEKLSGVRAVHPVPGRTDSLLCKVIELESVLALRTVVAAFLALTFDVPRPKSLTSGEHFPRIVAAIEQAKRLNADDPLRTFRFEAAGSDSPVFQRLADQVAQATGLVPDSTGGDCTIRFRRAVEGSGWDVLVRLTKRPLATRVWRRHGHPAAVNATIAAAMVRLTNPTPDDRVLNLMCGSGTLLIERLLAAPARTAVGVDINAAAVTASTGNIAAAGLADRVTVHQADVAGTEWHGDAQFDVVFADPPWGDKAGRHETNEALHEALLRRAYELSAPGARMVVLTHEIRVMQRCLRQAPARWTVSDELRVFAKGHHPRMYVLQRKS